MIATDMQNFFMQGCPQDEAALHNVQIFGRCSQPYLEKTDNTNQAVEFVGLSPLRKAP